MSAKNISYSSGQLYALVILRMLIGWHFLYEGIVKLWNPAWSARGFLMDSEGLFSGLFYAMATNATILDIVNFLNVWGLVLIGLGLLTGTLTRWASIGGMVLLGFYFLSHPPLIGVDYALPSEGSYLLINKNLIELSALGVLLYFPTSKIIGFDRLIAKWRKQAVPDEMVSVARSVEQEEVSV